MTRELLQVRDLCVEFGSANGLIQAVRGVSLDVPVGGRLAIVGESGSGKTTLALGILGLVDPPGRVSAASVVFEGADIHRLSQRGLRSVRGRRIGYVMQDPLTSLSPVYSVGEQIVETICAHTRMRRAGARQSAIDLLRSVGVPDPQRRVRDFPHAFSGGMRQRVAIAIALSCEPALLIADEPTTALDVTIQAQVLRLISRIADERSMGVVLITHDLGVVAGFADRVMVMFQGRVVEDGPVESVYGAPQHPYTKALLASQPQSGKAARLRDRGARADLRAVQSGDGKGCAFLPRCPLGKGHTVCATVEPALLPTAEDHRAACHLAPSRQSVNAEGGVA